MSWVPVEQAPLSWVPVVDLGGPHDAVVAAIGEACARVGFLGIVGHGVPVRIIDGLWSTAAEFFELSPAAKHTVAMPSPGYPYGYNGLEAEALARSLGRVSLPDLKESLAIGPAGLVPSTPADDALWAFSPTLWPDEVLPGLRPAWSAYFAEMGHLAARLLSLMAEALHLPPGHFAALIDRHASAMRALHYPAPAVAPPPGQLRAGAHTDYGTLTVLLRGPDDTGLQVQRPDGSWVDVPPVPGGFVVNLGDAMARWTNDRWVSTMHRVVGPDDWRDTRPRQSVAFFHNANWDALIECLPTCTSADDPPHYPPIAAGPHLMSKFQSTVMPPPATG